ncbi:cell division protein FtsW [Candidatus Uhrbacteria bacterium]|nr:cell division protein FtsW [Candidatus Uhrbacteria bacterium]
MVRPSPDRVFVGLAFGLLAIGLVMVLSASGPIGHQKFGDGLYFFRHQLLFGFLPGLALFLILKRIDYRIYRRYWLFFLVVSLVLLMLVFVPGLAGDWSQARSWIRVFGVSFQPVEAVKLTFLIFIAGWFDHLGRENLSDLRRGFLPFLAVLGAVTLLVGLQPDFGSLAVIVCSVTVAWFVAGAAWSHLVGLVTFGMAGLFLAMKTAPYRADRLLTFLHPELDPLGIGYHINQAYLAIGSGGWFGLGLGHSAQKRLYLPESFGDSVFAVMAEEFGFVMTLAFLAVLVAVLWRILRVSSAAPDGFGRILAAGFFGWIFFQSVFNIGSMLGLLPITGLPLPFVSYGGTSLAILMAALGVVANISSGAGTCRSLSR